MKIKIIGTAIITIATTALHFGNAASQREATSKLRLISNSEMANISGQQATGSQCKPGYCFKAGTGPVCSGGTYLSSGCPEDLVELNGYEGNFKVCRVEDDNCEERTQAPAPDDVFEPKVGAEATSTNISCELTKKGTCTTKYTSKKVKPKGGGPEVELNVPDGCNCGPNTGQYGTRVKGTGTGC